MLILFIAGHWTVVIACENFYFYTFAGNMISSQFQGKYDPLPGVRGEEGRESGKAWGSVKVRRAVCVVVTLPLYLYINTNNNTWL